MKNLHKATFFSCRFLIILSIGMACVAHFIDGSDQSRTMKVPSAVAIANNSLQIDNPSHSTNIKKLVLHFSLTRNFTWLYDTTKPPQSIAVMFGMK
jgi:hypothetical protein